MGEKIGAYRLLVGRCDGKRPLGRLTYVGVVGRIILNWIFKKWDREAWNVLLLLMIGTGDGEGYCKRCNEPSCSLKCREFLD